MPNFSFSSALSRTAFFVFGLLISIAVHAGTFTNTSTALTAPASSSTGSYTVSFKTSAWGTHYLQEKKDSGSWVNVASYATAQNGSSTTYPTVTRNVSLSGRTNGTYSYRVYFASANNITNSPPSGYSNTKVTVVSIVPGTPSSISNPESDNDRSFTVSWGAASGVVENYQLEQQADDGTNTWTQIYSGIEASKAITVSVDAIYNYRVKACNSNGCSGYQVSSNGTIVALTPGIPPNATLVIGETF